jgi:hypothetical protein
MEQNFNNCHHTGKKSCPSNIADNPYGDGDIPAEDTNPYYKNVEPLPESSRPRRDGPGGN